MRLKTNWQKNDPFIYQAVCPTTWRTTSHAPPGRQMAAVLIFRFRPLVHYAWRFYRGLWFLREFRPLPRALSGAIANLDCQANLPDITLSIALLLPCPNCNWWLTSLLISNPRMPIIRFSLIEVGRDNSFQLVRILTHIFPFVNGYQCTLRLRLSSIWSSTFTLHTRLINIFR